MAAEAQVWKVKDAVKAQYEPKGSGSKVLLVFSGDPSFAPGVKAWATALHDKVFKGVGVGHVYSVAYDPKTEDNQPPAELVTHFKDLVKGHPPVFVVAHSSGTYVAHALFKQLNNKDDKGILDKTTYYNIDGASYEGGKCPAKKIFAVYAYVKGPKGELGSRNPKSMMTFGKPAVRPMEYDDAPEKLLADPKAVAAYLHRRLIVKLDPPPKSLDYKVVTKDNVATEWIQDTDF
jgi:hypothetical protein